MNDQLNISEILGLLNPNKKKKKKKNLLTVPASVALLAAPLTNSTPARSATIFLKIDHEIFPSADLRRAAISFWWKNVHKYLVNGLED